MELMHQINDNLVPGRLRSRRRKECLGALAQGLAINDKK